MIKSIFYNLNSEIMISRLIQTKVEERLGRPIRYAKDCEILSVSIHAFTGEKISCSTVKRLFGLIESDNEPRLYTLDVIAQYLGYGNYDQFLQEFNPNKGDLNKLIETINVSDLKQGDTIQFKYEPNRFVEANYMEDCIFKIVDSNDPKVLKDDILVFKNVGRFLPLFASWRRSRNGSSKNIVIGKISGITSIELI
jgi:hypothetical protein